MSKKPEHANLPAKSAPVKAYFVNHLRTLIGSLGFLTRNALSTSMTMADPEALSSAPL